MALRLKDNKTLLFLILLAFSFLLFGRILNNQFWTAAEYEYLAQSLSSDSLDEFGLGTQHPHPIVGVFHRVEYLFFGDKPAGYYLLNIFIHALNAFLLYLLITMILHDFGIAFLSASLFAFAVGNYGKEVMYAAGVSGILMHAVFILTVMFYVINETRGKGRLLSWWFLGTVFFFTLSIVNRFAFLSGIGVLLAYNVFFRKERQDRGVLDGPLLTLLIFGGVLTGFQWDSFRSVTESYPEGWGAGFFALNFLRNIPGYLVHMVYPIHYTELVVEGSPLATIYAWSGWIRPVLATIIFSYMAYGFVFGNKTLRFFIAWVVLTILPFCFFYLPGDWINTKYLYLASAGFCLILATGTMKMVRVLVGRGWRRLVPLAIPVWFILLSGFLVMRLDHSYEERARLPETQQLKARFLELKRESLNADR
ncbi:MAG: hypothetical protein R3C71_15635 [Candidatus Krumholzibacteriia bacterium]|nr:hypothetical protein [bacterium]MCB9516533.1 hypothetical protein [Candidatus Latescibacterota bacterium]